MKRILLIAALLYVGAGLALGFRPFDDTFITFRYARALADGHGFSYNDGTAVLGTTTPLWTLVLAAAGRAGASLPAAALTLSLVADALSSWLLAALVRRAGGSRTAAVAAALLFLTTFDALSLARSGMEMPLFTLASLSALWCASHDRPVAAGVAGGLAALCRPEGLLVAGVATALAAHVSRWPAALKSALATIAVVTPWLLFAWLTFGSPVPQSVVAKAASANAPGLAHFSWINARLFFVTGQFGDWVFTRSAWSLQWLRSLLALAGLVAAWRAGWLTRWMLLAVPVGLFGGLAISHAFTWFPWYYGPFYPFLAALAAFGVDQWAPAARRTAAVVTATAVLVVAQAGVAWWIKWPLDYDFWTIGYREVVRDIPARPGTTIAASEVGAVGWYTWPATILDLEGLVTPGAHLVPPAQYIAAARADYVVLRSNNSHALLPALRREAWFLSDYEEIRRVPWPGTDVVFLTFRRRPSGGD